MRWIAAALVLAAGGCVYLPQIQPGEPTYAAPPDPQSRIAAGLDPSAPRALLVEDAHAALTIRLDMIDAADATLDFQYFIWQNDPSGILTIDKVLAAADRGVRVRALLDDVQLGGLVNRLNALNNHPNIEIRIFNPFSVRWRYQLGIWRAAEFVIDGNRLNHRMHNKLLVADNQLAILGGRNIGDDYFGLSRERSFYDLDVLLTGAVVPELSAGFDTYWNSRWAYPVNDLLNLSIIPDDLDRLRRRVEDRLAERPALHALALEDDPSDTFALIDGANRVERAEILVDDPSVAWFDKPDELANELTDLMLSAQREVLIVTPYLIPNSEILEVAETLVERGVSIKAITNSLETNDVVIAQAAYARYRRRIVESGVEVYELRGDAEMFADDPAEDICLHQKYILIDGRYVFMGSVNLDPRSLYLNTELGVMLDAPELVASMRSSFEGLIHPRNSWRIRIVDDAVVWESTAGTVDIAPAKSRWQRLRYWFFQLLPVSTQL